MGLGVKANKELSVKSGEPAEDVIEQKLRKWLNARSRFGEKISDPPSFMVEILSPPTAERNESSDSVFFVEKFWCLGESDKRRLLDKIPDQSMVGHPRPQQLCSFQSRGNVFHPGRGQTGEGGQRAGHGRPHCLSHQVPEAPRGLPHDQV